MRLHFHRCPNLRVVTLDVSDISHKRKGGSVILDELCQAKGLIPCLGLADCDLLTDGQRRELLVTRVTRLREQEGGPSELGESGAARARELDELANELLEEHAEIVDTNRRLLAEATAAFDDRTDGAPLGTTEDLSAPDIKPRSSEFQAARLDAIERGLEEIFTGAPDYGVCAACGGLIDRDRLRETPDSHSCRSCAARARPIE